MLKARQLLEQSFETLGVNVLWSEYPAGPQLLQALSNDEIDFGTTGERRPFFAQAKDNALLYVAWEPPAPRSSNGGAQRQRYPHARTATR